MTKTNPRFPRFFVPLLLAVTLAFVFKACKKNDFSKEEITEPVSKFFTVPANTPGPVLKVVDALKKQNDIGGFIPALAKNDGYAVWNKSVIELIPSTTVYNRDGDSETVDTLIFTPIVQQDSNFVNGFFFSRIVRDSVELHLYRANDYDLYPYASAHSTVVTAEFITLKILELNESIFGHRKYEITDSLLFATTNNSRTNFIRTTIEIDTTFVVHGKWAITSLCIESINCYCLQEGNSCGVDHRCMNGNCDRCFWCIDVSCTTIAIPGGGGTFSWPPDPDPVYFPGGGGDGNPPDNGDCTGTSNCRPGSLVAEGRVPCGSCGPGPMVVLPVGEPPLNSHPTDTSFLKSVAESISIQSDSVFNWAFLPGNGLREQGAIIVEKNGQIYLKNLVSGREGRTRAINYNLAAGESLLGYFHTHPVDTDYKVRSFFSDADFLEFHKNARTRPGYLMFLECGNKRFIVVVEDLQKYQEFMSLSRLKQLDREQYIENELLSQQPNLYSNGQQASINAAIQFFGSINNCGLGFYETDGPSKTNFVILNP